MKQTPLQIRYSVLEKYKFEQIADDLAIEFAEWFIEYKEFNKSKTTKELLEIFKKEKGWI